MKSSTLVAALLAGSAAAASHYKHRQFHDQQKKRAALAESAHVEIETETILMYSYNGKVIDEKTLCDGLKDGSIQWVGDNPPRPDCGEQPVPVASSQPAASAIPSAQSSSQTADGGTLRQQPSSSASARASASSPTLLPLPSGASSPDANSTSGSGGVGSLDNPNTDKDFPDGQLDCSTFPSDYGAVPVPWAGFSKWSGIQHAQISGNAVSKLATADKGKGCAPGPDGSDAYCSYACPAGFQKSQWPQQQGGAGYAVSVGGLRCGSDNKLYLTNSELSKKLCTRGTDDVSLVNQLGKGAAVCRTDYPGTEAETVPLWTDSGNTYPLTCPDSAQYYTHQGKPTTAEYYVNDAGVAVEQACQWGQDDSDQGKSYGNWAPLVIGAGKDMNGATWLSIQSSCQNDPKKCNDLSYSIELEGNFGGNNGCYYTQSGGVGYWCSQGKLSDFKPGGAGCQTKATQSVPGCTVQLMSGKASYKFVPTEH